MGDEIALRCSACQANVPRDWPHVARRSDAASERQWLESPDGPGKLSVMVTKDFRRHAHAFVDWMADYLAEVERYPVRAQVKPGEVAAKLPLTPPERGEPMEAIFADFTSVVLPGITHWQHPSFFAYFPANSSPPSVLAEMLTATLGAQCMLWQTSPAATELETRILDWLRQMTGLPEGFAGVIQDSASSAILCALLTARERATGWRANEEGVSAVGPLRVYCSTETHSATEKGAKIAGLGRANVRKIPVDARFAMRPDALEAAIRGDLAAGVTPVCVVASLGTTGVGAMDPLRTLEILPAFLKTRERGHVIDYRNWSVQLGRRFRALKLWFVIRAYGVAELRRMVAAHIALAREAAEWIEAAPDFELMAPRSLALLNFRYHPRGVEDPSQLDRLNERLLEALNDSGELYLTQNRVQGAYAIRVAIGQTATRRRHVEAAWTKIQETARALGG